MTRLLTLTFMGCRRLPVLVLLLLTAVSHAQEPLPTPDLDLWANGRVNALLRLPDGAIIIGGYFSHVAGEARSNLARIRPDGTLDQEWNPSPDDEVFALASNGTAIFVGGGFLNIGGQKRSFVARLSASGQGAAHATWDPSPSLVVRAMAIAPDGDVVIGGSFGAVGGVPRSRIAKLAPTGTGALDPDWVTSVDGPAGSVVSALQFDSAGALHLGGKFEAVNGQPRHNVAKVQGGGFGAVFANWAPVLDGPVHTLAVGPSGLLYIGGEFTTIDGLDWPRVARLQASGSVDQTWIIDAGGVVRAIAVDTEGVVYMAGEFERIGWHDDYVRVGIARTVPHEASYIDPDWDPGRAPMAPVRALAALPGFQVLAGGDFRTMSGEIANSIARIQDDGQLVATWSIWSMGIHGPDAPVRALVRQPNGGIIVGGEFVAANGLPRQGLLRLRPNGALDPTWRADVAGDVLALAVDDAGAVYAGGEFYRIEDEQVSALARIGGGGAGQVDPLWTSGELSGVVRALLPDGAGRLIVGGSFIVPGGLASANLTRIDIVTGLVDPSWNQWAAMDGVSALATDGNGILFAGGGFSSVNGGVRLGLAKFQLSTGALFQGWTADVGGTVSALALHGGQLYVGGDFESVGGVLRANLARVAVGGSGQTDLAWDPALDEPVRALTTDATGRLYVGGDGFSIAPGQASGLVRIEGANGQIDMTWLPNVWVGGVEAILPPAADAAGSLVIGGGFRMVAPLERLGIAAVPTEKVVDDRIFFDGFE